MILIFGGAYQGKLDYAEREYGGRVFSCTEDEIDYSAGIVDHLEKFSMACVHRNAEAADIIAEHMDELKDKVLICNDISGGVVPIEADLRAWREMNGRMLIRLAGQADRVVRMFCGIPQIIK